MKTEINKNVDGIRGIAIFLVVMYHFFPEFIPNGFIGVDIFFVISGYLIQGMLNRENFGLSWFYANRVKRIFPGLIVIFTTFIIVTYFTLLEDEYKEFYKYLNLSTEFKLNYYLANENSYFDHDNYKKLLLHIWSLCVEIHYYFIWPILFILIRKNKIIKENIFYILLALISLSIYIHNSIDNKIFSFYLSHNRLWEFIIGAISYNFFISKYFKYRNLSLYGSILILLSLFFINEKNNYPGLISIIPILGTILIIIDKNDSIFSRLTITNIFNINLGRISYEMYLWHWPLISLYNIVGAGQKSISIKILILVISLLFSWITKKICDYKIKKTSPYILISSLIIINLLSFNIYNNLISFERPIQIKYSNYMNSLKFSPLKDKCHDIEYAHIEQNWFCQFGNNNNRKIDFFVYGDSHAMSLLPVLSKFGNEENLSIAFSSTSACPPILNFEKRNNSEIIKKHNCRATNERIKNFIVANNIKNVIMISRWADYDYDKLKIELIHIISYYNKFNINIYIVDDNPLQRLLPQDALRLSNVSDESINQYSISRFDHNNNQKEINLIFESISMNYNFHRLNFDNEYCPNKICNLTGNNKFNYFDQGHLTVYGSLQIYNSFRNRLNEIRARKIYQ